MRRGQMMAKVMQVISFTLSKKIKTGISICLLLFIPLLNLSFLVVPENTKYSIPFLECGTAKVTLTPSVHETRDLQWMVSLASDHLVFIIVIVCFRLMGRWNNLFYLYIFYGSTRFFNHWLTYENWKVIIDIMPFVLIVVPIVYAVLYLFKSE